jgi:predicted aspartyl protease
MSIRAFIPVPLFLFLASCGAPPAAQAPCTLRIDADFPIVFTPDQQPIVTVLINQRPIKMLMDSGSDESYLFNEAYAKAGIKQTYDAGGAGVIGLGGSYQLSALVQQDLTFGVNVLHDEILGVDPTPPPMKDGQPIFDGVMGYDIMQHFNIGLDLPHRHVTFYDPEGCTVPQIPWVGDYAPVDFIRPQDGSPNITIQINNQNFAVTLDTGAALSLIGQKALQHQGVKPEAGPPQTDDTAEGMGGLSFGIQPANFQSISIGAETFSDAEIAVDKTPQPDLDATSDGLLGEDYLSTHRVFIANSNHTIYLGLTVAPGS